MGKQWPRHMVCRRCRYVRTIRIGNKSWPADYRDCSIRGGSVVASGEHLWFGGGRINNWGSAVVDDIAAARAEKTVHPGQAGGELVSQIEQRLECGWIERRYSRVGIHCVGLIGQGPGSGGED